MDRYWRNLLAVFVLPLPTDEAHAADRGSFAGFRIADPSFVTDETAAEFLGFHGFLWLTCLLLYYQYGFDSDL